MNTEEKMNFFLTGKETVGIAGHVRPDGDCVGSTLAIYNYIKEYYPQIDVRLYLEPIPNVFKFLRYADEIRSDYTDEIVFDLFIVCDCGDEGRLGNAVKYYENAKNTLCIDHHVSNQEFAQHNYIFPDASSTCELVYGLFDRAHITKEIAECLYTGMVHDTGVFQYSCTSAKTMNIAGQLMELGIDYSEIVDATFYTTTYAQNQILGQALLDSRLYLDGRCIISVVTKEEMDEFGVLPKHLDGIVNQRRVTKGVVVAAFMYQNEDGSFKVSLRANGTFDVAALAMHFGGGGHVKAAGYTAFEDAETAKDILLEEIEKRL